MDNASPHAVEQDSIKAIGLMTVGVSLLAAMDLSIKQLVEHYPSMQVVFIRGISSAPLLAIWMLVRKDGNFRVKYPIDHLLRALMGLVMLYAIGECFRELQLADAYAIFFAAPLLISILSGPVLGEKAGPFRLAAAAVGFVGVLVVLQPGMDSQLISYGSLMALVVVLAYSFMALWLRRMGHHDSTVTIAFWFIMLVGLGAGLLSFWNWRPFQWVHWPWVMLLGITGTFGQLMLVGAFKRASAAVIAPLDYTHMIWAVIYGYIFWGHLPGVSTWIGTTIIVASGLYIIFREHHIKQRQLAIIADASAQRAINEVNENDTTAEKK
jgi:drug/metabolite transporter (DMT)-like permease